jgi:hypothetical protein
LLRNISFLLEKMRKAFLVNKTSSIELLTVSFCLNFCITLTRDILPLSAGSSMVIFRPVSNHLAKTVFENRKNFLTVFCGYKDVKSLVFRPLSSAIRRRGGILLTRPACVKTKFSPLLRPGETQILSIPVSLITIHLEVSQC